jgi:hypothetical protein
MIENVQKHNNCKEFAVHLNFVKMHCLFPQVQNVE